MAPSYQLLEQEFASFCGKRYAVALNSGTSALHLALIALGVGPGDEVIVPDFTFVACAFAVTYTGATPIFVDCEDTFCIDTSLIEAKITSKTKAIMPVHVYSNMCNMEEVMRIAKKYNLAVIEDASEHHGVKLSDSDVACYSFQSSKQIHCEEGGILVTDNEEIYNEVSKLKTFYNDGNYYHEKLSFNYRMANSQAELALQSLRSFDGTLWVETHLCSSEEERNAQIQPKARVFFKPLSSLPMYNQEIGKNALNYSKIGYITYN